MFLRALLVVVALLVLAAGVGAAVVWFGPVTISDKRMLLDFLLGRGIEAPTAGQIEARLRAPEGFTVNAYSTDVPLARLLRFTSAGDLIVTRTRAGEVTLLLRDADGDGRADGQRVLLADLDRPHGVALHDGWLYIAETTAIGRAHFDEQRGVLMGPYEHIVTGLGGDGLHLTRTIGFGPDGALYLSQGSTCNVCEEQDERRATIMRFEADGSGGEIVARGLRNSVGFDWAPWDGALYATENGRDLLGDDFPPDELNRIEPGQFYGWPYVNGFGITDPGTAHNSRAFIESMEAAARPPVYGFRAHNAPLGIRFLRTARVPESFGRAALVALHGSWNRSRPDGYKVVSLHWHDGRAIEERDFLTGFLGPEGILGRPVDVAEGPDGAIYVSDDYAGTIYRVSYAASPVAASPGPAESR